MVDHVQGSGGPAIAVEIITENFIHCLLKGLHKAPRLSHERGMSNKDVDFMVSPYGCFGTQHQACLDANIPVIVVRKTEAASTIPNTRNSSMLRTHRGGRHDHGHEGGRSSRVGAPSAGFHERAETTGKMTER